MILITNAASRLCFVRLYSISIPSRKPPISQKVKFIDQLRIVAKGGNGGGGSSALFGRTGHYPRAAGGNGAPGGCVILRASKQLTGLGSIPLHVEADRGGSGGKQWMDGKKGADRVVNVPLGTLVWQLLETRQGPAAAPHGVTALPTPASMPGLVSGQLAGSAAAVAGGAVGSAAPVLRQHQVMQSAGVVGATTTSCSTSTSTGSSSSRSSGRQHLFPEHALQHDGPKPTAAAAADLDQSASPWNMQHSKEQLDVDYSSSSSLHAAVSEAETPTDALYQQLISCKRLLSNAEKLALLRTGRLPETLPAAAGRGVGAAWRARDDWGTSADDFAAAAGHWNCATSADDEEGEEGSEGEGEDVWTGEGWAGAGDYAAGFEPEELERQFSKRQVWSILESQAVLLGELDQEGQQVCVALGGRGGRGNAVSPSKPHGPASRARTDGGPGQEVMLLLKLRLLADVVLVGLPNVGKSSLIAALTRARAQIGSYAFTTLRPQLGTITDTTPSAGGSGSSNWYDDQLLTADARSQGTQAVNVTPVAQLTALAEASAAAAAAAVAAADQAAAAHGPVSGPQPLVLADLPGLVPGAHTGKGRGTAFLAHLQRARCIALVLDMTGGEGQEGEGQQSTDSMGQGGAAAPGGADQLHGGGSDEKIWGMLVPYSPIQQLEILQEELSKFDFMVLQLPMVVVANKLDALSPAASSAALQQLKSATALPIVPVSAKQGLGLHRLKNALQLIAGR